jgi:porin
MASVGDYPACRDKRLAWDYFMVIPVGFMVNNDKSGSPCQKIEFCMMPTHPNILLLIIVAWFWLTAARAHEISEKWSLGGVLSAAVQCQRLTGDSEANDTCKGAVPFQPELTYRPGTHDRLYLKLGFAKGNGLNDVTPFNLSSWGADLEDDVKNINGSGRDYLLEAWYEHAVEMGRRNRLGLTLGIIDASRYLDQNAFANDEYTQFMNPALSNAPNTFFPAYEPGIAADWHLDQWIFSAVYMKAHQTSVSETYDFYGLQASYRLDTTVGTGNYRVLINGNRDFVDEMGEGKQDNDTLLVSFDQRMGKKMGLFARMGWRLDDEVINYRAIYSGGVDIRGATWGRVLDNIGVALVYLDGGDSTRISTRVAELYYRFVINPYIAITPDIQYMQDRYFSSPEAEGFIYSLRMTVNI